MNKKKKKRINEIKDHDNEKEKPVLKENIIKEDNEIDWGKNDYGIKYENKFEQKEEKQTNKINDVKIMTSKTKSEKAYKTEVIKSITPKKEKNIENLFNESKIISDLEDKKLLVNWVSSKGDIKK